MNARAALTTVGLAVAIAAGACSNSPTPAAVDASSTADTARADSGSTPDAGAPPADGSSPCISTTALHVVFAPMYSATDGMHRFQIPAIVDGIDSTLIIWTSSNPAIATLAPDPTTGGTMITVQSAGTATITAQAGNLCGTSLLTVESATPEDWAAGNARYNDGVDFRPVRPGGRDAGAMDAGDASAAGLAACTNCHGPTAMGPYATVSHTPEQAGGFSTADLDNIIRNGVVPDGGYFDPAIVPYAQWHSFHQWTMTDTELHGVIVYLRSLTPTPQTGMANFGGRGGDGGMRGDGGFRGDGGGPVVDGGG